MDSYCLRRRAHRRPTQPPGAGSADDAAAEATAAAAAAAEEEEEEKDAGAGFLRCSGCIVSMKRLNKLPDPHAATPSVDADARQNPHLGTPFPPTVVVAAAAHVGYEGVLPAPYSSQPTPSKRVTEPMTTAETGRMCGDRGEAGATLVAVTASSIPNSDSHACWASKSAVTRICGMIGRPSSSRGNAMKSRVGRVAGSLGSRGGKK